MGSKARLMLATAGEARIGRFSHQLCYKVNWGSIFCYCHSDMYILFINELL